MGAKEMFALVDYGLSDWGAEADYVNRPKRPGNDQVFVHHPGYGIRDAADSGNVNSEKATLRDIETSAMKRGWWGIQYDIIVGQSGTIYEGRGFAQSGATSGDVDEDGTHNNVEGEAILVLVAPSTPMTDECRASLARLLEAHGGAVYGHKEAKGTKTSCPGDDRMAFLDDFRNPEPPEAAPAEPKTTIKKPTTTKSAEKKKTTKSDWTEDIVSALGVHKKGQKFDHRVKRAQALLNLHRAGLKVDGKYGRLTEAAVVAFQEDQKIGVDGITGPKTWSRLLLNP